MPSGNHYELIDKQISQSQILLNVYCYEQISGSGGAEELANTWETEVLPAVLDIQSANVGHTNIIVNNLDDLSDFFDKGLTGQNGSVSGDMLPVYDAFVLKMVRGTRASRNGWKRIPGVAESAQHDGIVGSTTFTALGTLAGLLFDELDAGDGNTWKLRIWRRHREASEGHPEVAQAFFPIADVEPLPNVSTQNTRKIGRGI
jgi:hypothetical protein